MTPEISPPNSTVADILIEALPYIRKFSGMTVVVKYGGHAMVDEQLKTDFARDITLLKFIGLNPVVVHGGGPQINRVLDQMGIRPQFVRGMRLTDGPTMDVVEMVLGGKVNKSIVAQINQQGGRAVGLSGKDGGLIEAKKMRIVHQNDAGSPPEIIDPGMVGEVTCINPQIINTLSEQGFIPIIAPVGAGTQGETRAARSSCKQTLYKTCSQPGQEEAGNEKETRMALAGARPDCLQFQGRGSFAQRDKDCRSEREGHSGGRGRQGCLQR